MAGHVPVGLDRGKAGGIGVSGVPIEAPATRLKSARKRDMRGGKTIVDIAQNMIRVMAAGARPLLAPTAPKVARAGARARADIRPQR